jgi:hypothetical protein
VLKDACARIYQQQHALAAKPNANTPKQRNADKAEQKSSNADKDHNRGQMERWKAQAKGRKAERSDERDRKERRWGRGARAAAATRETCVKRAPPLRAPRK